MRDCLVLCRNLLVTSMLALYNTVSCPLSPSNWTKGCCLQVASSHGQRRVLAKIPGQLCARRTGLLFCFRHNLGVWCCVGFQVVLDCVLSALTMLLQVPTDLSRSVTANYVCARRSLTLPAELASLHEKVCCCCPITALSCGLFTIVAFSQLQCRAVRLTTCFCSFLVVIAGRCTRCSWPSTR